MRLWGDFVDPTHTIQRELMIQLQHFDNGEFSVPIRISTINDNVFEANGSVVISILEGKDYTILEEHGATRVEFTVLDNDAPENISIVANNPQITEGDSVKFEIWSHQIFSYDRPIYFEVIDESNILSTNLPEICNYNGW